MEGIANRIQELVAKLNLKPSSFASKIAVSPSILSHVLNGRNKASLDLILKIHEAFPEVDLEWLLTGNSTLKVDEVQKTESTKSRNQPKSDARIVILHSNGTYEEFVKS
ncbi:MAG: transcriptional regulator with XRE-family HTH domain [Granulosicoccus sp.]|jgi:transcriptional regulator with XRE-family HTH domain